MSEAYNIVYSFSDLYAKIAGISILSLLKNNANLNLHIHILADRLSIQNKNKLIKTVNDYKQIISFYDISTKLESIKNIISYNGGMAPFAKFFIADIITSTKKVLYIDSDTLIVSGIQNLFCFDMRNKSIALSSDCIRNEYKKYIHLPYHYILCATGVVLFDLQKWNERKCLSRILEELQNPQVEYKLADLDLINTVLKDEIAYYDIRYQMISQFLMYSYTSVFYIFKLPKNTFTQMEYTDAVSNPVIYHFCGNTFIRPWYKNSKHPIKTLYDSYYFQSEWKDEPQQQFAQSLPYKIQYIMWKYFPKILFYLFSKIMQRIFMLRTYNV